MLATVRVSTFQVAEELVKNCAELDTLNKDGLSAAEMAQKVRFAKESGGRRGGGVDRLFLGYFFGYFCPPVFLSVFCLPRPAFFFHHLFLHVFARF